MFVINKKIIVFLGAVLLVGIILVINQLLIKPESFPPKSGTGLDSEVKDKSSSDGNAIIENIPTSPIQNHPRYAGRPLNEVRFGKGFDAPKEFVEKKRKELNVLVAVLSVGSSGSVGVDDWIAVGVIKKFFNDYEGARDAWEYAGVLYPNNGLSFANLGNLYGLYLRDSAKAEANFEKAIANDPYQPGYYIGLADFYDQVDTAQKSKVPEVILAGLKYVRDVNLFLRLATYYRDAGDKANAVKYYEEVLKIKPDHAGVREEIEQLR